MAPQPTRAQLAALVDHTLLKPEATAADVVALLTEAAELGVYAVCVSPSMVPVAVQAGGVRVAAVAGFPSGKHVSTVKALEAAQAVASGAVEIDMVIDIGAALAGDIDVVRSDIGAVRAAIDVAGAAVLKVIVESSALVTQAGTRRLAEVCRAAEDAGADFVKTSTGFHPTGGASVEAVAVMAATVGGRLGIKASGGIRTAADAVAMLDAGATRLGLSGTRAVLDGLSPNA
jgi:deoxyribose-phosphate aldolase